LFFRHPGMDISRDVASRNARQNTVTRMLLHLYAMFGLVFNSFLKYLHVKNGHTRPFSQLTGSGGQPLPYNLITFMAFPFLPDPGA
jgi:hypothetical protein